MSDRNAWIKTIAESDAEGELADLYEQARDRHTGTVDNIIKVHSIYPRVLRNHLDLYLTIMHRRSSISRTEREMMAVVVSVLNECHY
ncbi:MAG: carboxymuconolactone decarboxylase family protein [Proteobacteria bacterium]|nr:carboxymuconolactone decarboxylase family protein [Pseudomonadota bacterium]